MSAIFRPQTLIDQIIQTQASDSDIRDLLGKSSRFQEKNSVIYFDNRIVVPKSLRPMILQSAHGHPLAGHFGFNKTFSSISSQFYWPKLRHDLKHFLQSCDLCGRYKLGHSVGSNVGGTRPIRGLFDTWSIDIVGPLPQSQGMKYLLVAVELFTRWVSAFPLSSIR